MQIKWNTKNAQLIENYWGQRTNKPQNDRCKPNI